MAVEDVGDLVQHAFTQKHVVQASLKNGYFGKNLIQTETTGTEKAIGFLASDLERRFWHALREHLSFGQSSKVFPPRLDHIEFHLREEIYPKNTGKKLYQALAAAPPFTRRHKLKYPLCPIMTCIQLGLYAEESDSDDFLFLLKACSGENVGPHENVIDRSEQPEAAQSDPILQTILNEINRDNLGVKVSQPIDNARSSFLMESVRADSYGRFLMK